MNEIEDFLEHLEIGFVRIDGHSSQPIRTAAVAKFQEDDKVLYPTVACVVDGHDIPCCLSSMLAIVLLAICFVWLTF